MFDPQPQGNTPLSQTLDGKLGALLPRALHPYARLLRLDKPIGWWLLLLPCWWGTLLAGPGLFSLEFYGWYLLPLFLVGAVAMRGAGCIINDMWDRNFDAAVERTAKRPLVTGEVPLWGAALALSICLFIGILVLVQLSRVAILLALLSMILVTIYPLMKRVTYWPQIILGFTFNIGTLLGWSSIAGQVDAPAGVLYLAGLFWTLGYDTIYAYQDRKDDETVGVKSTALLFGKHGKLAVSGFYTAAVLFWALAVWLVSPMQYAYLTIAPVAVLLAIQVLRWNPDNAESCWKAFAHNRDIGLLVALACALCFIPWGPG
jgi:4-hydroxybenzoate polyprenyltransferase